MADLTRFLDAQDRDYVRARDEIARGRKVSHWMWYVFPQLAGLGRSETARFYGIADAREARDYLAHPVLGPRLVEMARLMLGHEGVTAETILGPVDAMKLRSSMTLFASQPGAAPEFAAVLEAFFAGQRCRLTEAALGRS
jgi:uncharacterized protein (DUF1810 family)